MSELNNKSSKKTKGKNSKKKGTDDNVNEAGIGGLGQEDFQPTKKRRRQKDKDKNRQDNLAEGSVDNGTAPNKSKKRRKKQTE